MASLIPAPSAHIHIPTTASAKSALLRTLVTSPDPASHHRLAPVVLDIGEWERLLTLANHPKKDFIMDALHNGVDIGNTRSPTTPRFARNLTSAVGPENEEKILDEIVKEVRLGRWAGPFTQLPFANLQCSPIGAVPKKNSTKLRFILHLSYPRDDSCTSINSGLKEIKCEYLALETVLKTIKEKGPGCLLSKFDINDAFRYIRLRTDVQFLLGFAFQGLFYYERCLPFGLSPAPGIFELFATTVNDLILFMGVVACFHYMDDFICVSSTVREQALKDFLTILAVFNALGISLSSPKLERPTTCLDFLGYELDTVAMEIRLPKDKLERYAKELESWKGKCSATRHELQSIVGILVHASRVIPHSRSFYQRLLSTLRKNKQNKGPIKITSSARADIQWWSRFIKEWNGVGLIPPSIEDYIPADRLELFTDASSIGMGGWCASLGEYTLHQWNADELEKATRKKGLSIPFLELTALVHSINIWQRQLAGKALTLHCDAEIVVKSVNSGRSYDPDMMQLIRILIAILSRNNIFLNLVHIEGAKNIYADALSRSNSPNASLFLQLYEDHRYERLQSHQWAGSHPCKRSIQPLPIVTW